MSIGIFILGLAAIAQPGSMNCGDSAVVQSQIAHGPGGSSAVLKASGEDDHAKDTHLCMADYKLELTRGSGQPENIALQSSDNEWGRKISVQLSGFSADGKRIFGMLSEGGASPVQQIFEYSTDDGNVRFFDLDKLAAHIAPPKCIAKAQVIGTIESGALVIRMDTGNRCDRWARWRLSSVKGPLQRLPKSAAIQGVFESGNGAH